MERELRLQKEAKKELKRRIRRRRARAAGLNPSLLPKLRLSAAEFAKKRGFFAGQSPSSFLLRVPPGIATTTRRLVGTLRGGGWPGTRDGRDGGGVGVGGAIAGGARRRSRSRSRSPARNRGAKRLKSPDSAAV